MISSRLKKGTHPCRCATTGSHGEILSHPRPRLTNEERERREKHKCTGADGDGQK